MAAQGGGRDRGPGRGVPTAGAASSESDSSRPGIRAELRDAGKREGESPSGERSLGLPLALLLLLCSQLWLLAASLREDAGGIEGRGNRALPVDA